MARRAAALVLLAVIALASSGVAYWLVWGGETNVSPGPGSERPADPRKVARHASAVSRGVEGPVSTASGGAEVVGDVSHPVAAPGPQAVPEPAAPASSRRSRYVMLVGESIVVFTSDPSKGGKPYLKRPFPTSGVPRGELERLTEGLSVESDADALSLIEGLSGTTD